MPGMLAVQTSGTIITTRMHSSRMRTAPSLPYGGGVSGVSIWGGGVSVQAVSVQGVGFCPGGSLSRRVSVQQGSLSRGVTVQGSLCPEGSLSGGLCPGGLCPGGLCLGGLCPGGSLFRGSLSRGFP